MEVYIINYDCLMNGGIYFFNMRSIKYANILNPIKKI